MADNSTQEIKIFFLTNADAVSQDIAELTKHFKGNEEAYNKLTLEAKKLNQAEIDLTIAQANLAAKTKDNTLEYYKLEKAVTSAQKSLERQVNSTANVVQKFQSVKSGLATSVSGFNSLSNSVNQLSRELPNFAQSTEIGIRSISNNIGPLLDSFDQIRSRGGTTKDVFKEVGKALFSFNTLVSVATTLLVIYGEDIAKWIATLFEAQGALGGLARAQKSFNEAQREGLKNASAELIHLDRLTAKAKDVNSEMSDRVEAVEELQSLYPNYLGNLTQEEILAGDVGDAYLKLAEDIKQASIARAIEDRLTKIAIQRLELEAQFRNQFLGEDKSFWGKLATNAKNALAGGGNIGLGMTIRLGQMNQELEALDAEADALTDKLLGIGLQDKTKTPKTKKPKVDTTLEDLKIQELKSEQEIQKQIIENDESTYGERIDAQKKFHSLEQHIIGVEKEKEIKQAIGNKNKIALAIAKEDTKLKHATTENLKKVEQITKDSNDKVTKSFQDRADEIAKIEEERRKRAEQLVKDLAKLDEEAFRASTKFEMITGKASFERNKQRIDTIFKRNNAEIDADQEKLLKQLELHTKDLLEVATTEEQKKEIVRKAEEEKTRIIEKENKKRAENQKARDEEDFAQLIEKTDNTVFQIQEGLQKAQEIADIFSGLDEVRKNKEIANANGNAEEIERINRKYFEKEKKAKVVAATLSGLASITSAYAAGVKAAESFGVTAIAAPAWGAAYAAIAAVTTGIQISKIKSVQYDSDSGSGGGSGGGSIPSTAQPNVSFVASSENQLADAIGTTTSNGITTRLNEKPIKAFVVSSDVTTQQELDRKLLNTTTIG